MRMLRVAAMLWVFALAEPLCASEITTHVQLRDYYAEINGARLHVRDWGPVDAEPLFLLHGGRGHAHVFDTLAPLFARTYRAIAVSYRGHGNSTWTGRSTYSFEQVAQDVHDLKKALGLGRIRIYGQSAGGVVGTWYAAAYPEALSHLVIGDVGPNTEAAYEAAISVMRPTGVGAESRAAYLELTKQFVPQRLHESYFHHQALLTQDGRWKSRFDPSFYFPVKGHRPTPEAFWAKIDRVQSPTLLIRGADSEVLDREVALRMDRTLPDNTFVEFEGVGHNVLYRPDLFLDVVEEFLGR